MEEGEKPRRRQQRVKDDGSNMNLRVAAAISGGLARDLILFRKQRAAVVRKSQLQEFPSPLLLDKGIKIVTNAGGLDPVGLKNSIEAHAEKCGLGHRVKVAAVLGDDILSQKEALLEAGSFKGFDPLSRVGEEEDSIIRSKLLSLNAYLGAQPITVALKEGANIVITGRCVDSALVVGPLAFEYGYKFSSEPESLDQLASASLAGHIIECGVQATGGNYTDWKDSAFSSNGGWVNMGYPILTFHPDHSFTISKTQGTGGVVNTQSVCEQMLYEVLDPHNYVLPDVVLDMSQVTMKQQSLECVLVQGARGKPPTPWLKCTTVEQQGYRISVDILVCGEEAESKAETLGSAILGRTNALVMNSQTKSDPVSPISDEDSEIHLIGAENSLSMSTLDGGERREIVLRVAARHKERFVLDILGKEAASFLTNSAPGICMLTTGRPKSSPNFAASSILVQRDAVKPKVYLADRQVPIEVPHILDGCEPIQISTDTLATHASRCSALKIRSQKGKLRTKLHMVAVGRSGDKGDSANIAIIARNPAYYKHIKEQVTSQVVFSRLSHFIGSGGTVTSFEVPGVHAINFVVTKALGGGGLSSLRLDRQAKSYAQLILATTFVDLPADAGLTSRI